MQLLVHGSYLSKIKAVKRNNMMNVIRLGFISVILSGTILCNEQTNLQEQQNIHAVKKVRRVYIDIVGDLFHIGHVNAIKQARAFGDYLIVGVHGDEVCTNYKRRPILTLQERIAAVAACRYVDEVIPDAPLIPTEKFFDEHHIDIVVHGDDFNQEKLKKYYSAAIARGILRIVPYTKGISTSDIISRILSRAEELSGQLKKNKD
jgi:cytidyltransferase-like protein